MRLLTLLLALGLVTTSVQAQSAEAVFFALSDLASQVDGEDEDSGGLCGTGLFGVTEADAASGDTGFSCAEWSVIIGVGVAFVGALYLFDNGACGSCATPALGSDSLPSRASSTVTVEDDAGVRRPLLLQVVRSQPRGVGTAPAPITLRAFDAETRQAVALGPLGSATATVRTADDLRALLSDR